MLGHLVLYSVFDGLVTRDDLERWFTELGLNRALVPPPIRPVDAFEKVTGRGIRVTYPLDPQLVGRRHRRRRGEAPYREATLMVRHVRRDSDQVVRHLVREVRDEGETRLSYDTCLAQCIFRRDGAPGMVPAPGRCAWHRKTTPLPACPKASSSRSARCWTTSPQATGGTAPT